jgi:hypothetical protein
VHEDEVEHQAGEVDGQRHTHEASSITERSMRVPRRRAEITPASTPLINQMTAAPTASDRVTGKRFTSSGHTSWLVRKEIAEARREQWSTLGPS